MEGPRGHWKVEAPDEKTPQDQAASTGVVPAEQPAQAARRKEEVRTHRKSAARVQQQGHQNQVAAALVA